MRLGTRAHKIALSILWLGILLTPLLAPAPAEAQRGVFFHRSWNSPWGWNSRPWGVRSFAATSFQVGAWGGGWGWGAPVMPLLPAWSAPPAFIAPPIFLPPVVTSPIFPPVIWGAQPFGLGWGGWTSPTWGWPNSAWGWGAQPVGWGGWGVQPFGVSAWANPWGFAGGAAGGPWLAANAAAPLPALDPLPAGPLENLQGAPLPPLRAANAEARARAQRFIEIGDRYFDQQNFRSAYVRYDQATDAAPDMVEAQLRKGQSLLALGNYDMAAQAFKQVVRVKDWTDSPLRWQQIYGKNLVAKDTHLQALATEAHNNPNNADLMFLLGLELFFDDQIPRSVKFFQRYAALRDGEVPALDPANGNQAFVGLFNENDQARLNRPAALAAPILPADNRPKPQPPPAIGEARNF